MDPLNSAQVTAIDFAAQGDSSAHGHVLSESPTAQMLNATTAVETGNGDGHGAPKPPEFFMHQFGGDDYFAPDYE